VDTEHETVRVEGEPIVFVDGVQVMEMPDLDPDDIERIEVLKGPAAEALMGAEARNGVVQIFLKTPPASNPGG
jgi:TonB-dependent SusC/RagA subfamily outer membrane receptor